MNSPLYKKKPIGSVEALAATLGFQKTRLLQVAENAHNYYIPNTPTIKPNGKIRQTYKVQQPLKHVQNKILRTIIDFVEFPDYLQGAIQDPELPRDYVRDAELHSGREVVLKEDISAFFSTTKSKFVYKMWKHFFNFPPEVAELLTKLTTYNGFIPEGASTSSAVANLMFWDCEPELEALLKHDGYVYSRYIDDVTVSFVERIDVKAVQEITTRIYGMFMRIGLKPNRKKRNVQTRNKKIHNLNMDSGRPTMPKAKRAKIRAAVHRLEVLASTGISWDQLKNEFDKVNGGVQLLRRLHPGEAKKYVEKLGEIKKQAILFEE